MKERELLGMWRDYLAADRTGSPGWKTRYWKAGKARLKQDTAGKCAYCESPTDAVAHGDVEHFRPKATYWWLAYCFDNHLYSCQICNQKFKGDKFPLASGGKALSEPRPRVSKRTTDAALDRLVDKFAPDAVAVGAGYTLAAFAAGCAAENAGLPDPYAVNPEPYFRWEADATNGEVKVIPRPGTPNAPFVVASCEAAFGLNREELRRLRWTLAYQPLATLRDILQEIDAGRGNPRARQLTRDAIHQMKQADKPYAAMVRYFVDDVWQIP